VSWFHALNAIDPRSASSVFAACAEAIKRGHHDEALPVATRGTRDHPHDARVWQVKGLAHRARDEMAEAADAFAQAARLAPKDALIAHSLARTSLEAGLPARALFDGAQKLAPADRAVLLGRAAALFAEGRGDEAIAAVESALAAEPGWLQGHATASRLRWMRGEREGFTASYERALAVMPGSMTLWQVMTLALVDAGLHDDAAAALARARNAVPAGVELDALTAICASERGDIAAADPLFAALPDGSVPLAVRRIRHLLRAGRPREAAERAERHLGGAQARHFWHYAAAAWRLNGDPRWEWLEGDPRLVGVYDLAGRIGSLDALAARLRTLHVASHAPLDQSLRGGTQTDGPLFSRAEPEIAALKALVVETVERHVAALPPPVTGHPLLGTARAPIRFAGSWSVRLTGEGYHIDHFHPAGWISSAFYVTVPEARPEDPQHAGWLTLGEVRDLNLNLPPVRVVEPKPGRLVLFPSTMWHGTRPFPAGERMTVAFDIAPPPQAGS
jgi:tetratricopeptide (TPR) repeat protein